MAVDIFLKVEGIEGETQDHQHKDQMEIRDYAWKMTSPRDSFTGQVSGKPRVENLTVLKRVDKGTPKFMEALVKNKNLGYATLSFRKAGLQAGAKPQMDYLVIKLSDVYVAEWSPAGTDGDALLEKIAFNFRKFDVLYKMQKEDGTPAGEVSAGYDASAHK
ncbi:MAG: type VI secretion system tube protein Hcp [Methylobacteriaceae bacterium]|nr:type VI secretion system tube protein Hcp [Methylobacteriaceae bacterium]